MAIRYLAAVLVLVVAGCSHSGGGNAGSQVTAGAGGQSVSGAATSVDQTAVTNTNLVTFTVPGMS